MKIERIRGWSGELPQAPFKLTNKEKQPAEHLPAGNLPAENLPAGNLPAENLPAGSLPGENLPAQTIKLILRSKITLKN